MNIPVPELRIRHTELDIDMQITLICRTGLRSSLAASLLKQQGFRNVSSVAGGMAGYNAAGYALECPMCSIPHGPRFLGRPNQIDLEITQIDAYTPDLLGTLICRKKQD